MEASVRGRNKDGGIRRRKGGGGGTRGDITTDQQ